MPSLKAILARFSGNKTQAMYYCQDIAQAYPHLRAEYFGYLNMLLELKG